MTEEELKGLEGKEAEYELQEKEVVNVTETTGVKRQFFVTEVCLQFPVCLTIVWLTIFCFSDC